MKAQFYTGRTGHEAESRTETDKNGKFWEIHTYKSGQFIVSNARQMTDEGNGSISFMMCSDPSKQLCKVQARATEAKIREVHEQAIAAFKALNLEQPAAEVYEIKPGQVIRTKGHENSRKRVVYEVTSPGQYKTVTTDGQQLQRDSHLQDEEEAQGIAVVYRKGEFLPLDTVAELVKQATEADNKRKEAARLESEERDQARARKIEEGARILPAIPAGVTHVIVAELHHDESDSQSDYFSHSTKETIFLAWSRHGRDIFSEMRAAADKDPRTAHLGTGKGVFIAIEVNESENRRTGERQEFTTMAEAQQFVNQQSPAAGYSWIIQEREIEHREKYSMGSGYYLKDGHSNATGWAVKKRSLSGYGTTLEELQIAAAEDRVICANEPATATEAPNFARQDVPAGTVQIIDYSEKAIAVIGETKPIKDTLKALGGKFNFRLNCGPGWIFSKNKLEAIQNALSKPKAQAAPEATPEPEEAPEPAQEATAPAEEPEPAQETQATARALQLAEQAGQRAAEHNPSRAAEAMEAAAAKLLKMAAEHREAMKAKAQAIQDEQNKTLQLFA